MKEKTTESVRNYLKMVAEKTSDCEGNRSSLGSIKEKNRRACRRNGVI